MTRRRPPLADDAVTAYIIMAFVNHEYWRDTAREYWRDTARRSSEQLHFWPKPFYDKM